MAQQLQGKTVLITGASSGIGEATARMLAAEGAKVALVARRKDRLDTIAGEIAELAGTALAIEGDITERAACLSVVKQVIAAWGRIDILINNAGVMLLGPALEAPLDEWVHMVELNVTAALTLTHTALPHMVEKKTGHIVNISSVAGRTTRAGSAVYNATKWGLGAFTEALRQELAQGKTGIRTTLIEPGATDTELRLHNRPEIQEQMRQRFGGITVLQADDIARAILYAVTQPPHVSINEILIRPTEQA